MCCNTFYMSQCMVITSKSTDRKNNIRSEIEANRSVVVHLHQSSRAYIISIPALYMVSKCVCVCVVAMQVCLLYTSLPTSGSGQRQHLDGHTVPSRRYCNRQLQCKPRANRSLFECGSRNQCAQSVARLIAIRFTRSI